MESKFTSREKATAILLETWRSPCPEIVAARRYRHKATGKTIGVRSCLPFGTREDWDVEHYGYCFRDKDGITFGQVAESEDALRSRWERNEAHRADESRAGLAGRTDAQLAELLAYYKIPAPL